MRSERYAQQGQRQRTRQTEKNEQRIIHIVPVDMRRISRREENVGRLGVMMWVVDGMVRLGRR